MKVKDMISMLQKHNPDEEVIVRFAVDPLDSIGYTLGTIDIDIEKESNHIPRID